MRLKLIDEWRHAHRFGSVRLSAAMATLFGIGPSVLSAWSDIPDDLKQALPHGWAQAIAVGGFVLVLLARIFTIEQRGTNGGPAS